MEDWNEWLDVSKELRRNKAVELLSRRELQVFIWSGLGKTPMEISAIMQIARPTIGTYRMGILRKMELENVYQVMEYFIRNDMDSQQFMGRWLE